MSTTLLLALLAPQATTLAAPLPTPASAESTEPQHLSWADQDGDGRLDLYVAAPDGGRLLLQDAEGRFAPAAPGMTDAIPGRFATWRDVDGDTDPDLFVWGADGGHLLVNEGAGALRDATEVAGLTHDAGVVRRAQWLDLDGDGREDLILHGEERVVAFRDLGGVQFGAFVLGDVPSSPATPVVLPTSPNEDSGETANGPTPVGNGSGPDPSLLDGPMPYDDDLERSATPCPTSLRDAINGGCLQASSFPTLGMLMPLSVYLNVATSGFVGIGTTTPNERLTVVGNIETTGQLKSTIFGVPPLVVESDLVVPKLNADRLDGFHASSFSQFGSLVDGFEIANNTITNSDISNSAFIRGTKIDADFGDQDILGDRELGIGTTSPYAAGHFVEESLGLNSLDYPVEDLIVESNEAYLTLASDGFGSYGSVFSMKQYLSGSLTDNWSILRETNGTGSDLIFTYGTSGDGASNEEQLVIQKDGDVGIGTTSPSVKLHVDDGTDVNLAGGGYLLLGPTNGVNVAIDNNEIAARNDGGAARLALNVDGGDVTIAQNSPDAGLSIGVAGTTARLEIADDGDGDSSVILPDDAISQDEILDEPGVTSDHDLTTILINGTAKTIQIATIQAPADGYVIAFGHVVFTSAGVPGIYRPYLEIQDSPGTIAFGDVRLEMPANDERAATVTRVFPVSAGPNNIYMRSRNDGSAFTLQARDPRLTLLYVPSAYGTVE